MSAMQKYMESIYKVIAKIKDSSLNEKIEVYGRMIKFSHSIFALPFALSAVVLATRTNTLTFWTFLWIIIAMVAARSAAMGFNRLVDADIDKQNPRTEMREIPSGAISKNATIKFIAVSGFIFIFSAVMLGKICFYFSIPVLILLLLYSYTKRFTMFCHIYLGFVISLAPIGAWVAVTNSLSWPIVCLSLALMTNIAGFDILYACQDVKFDSEEKLFSIPSTLGVQKALKISTLLHVATFLFFTLFFFAFGMSAVYAFTLLLIGGLLVIEHRLVKPDDLSNVNIAFFHINSILSVVLLVGIIINELIC